MYSVCKLLLCASLTAAPAARIVSEFKSAQPRSTDLRVCADPQNLPFSNQQEQGFENQLARLVARELGRTLKYVWSLQRGNFVRATLDAGACDVLIGVPAGYDAVQTTIPYYRASYVLISRHDRHLNISSLSDEKLKKLRIGVAVGSDYSSPPAQVLAMRGLAANITGYAGYGNLAKPDPPILDLVRAVTNRDVDIAVGWGPQAGYFVKYAAAPLDLLSIQQERDAPAMQFAISMGVRRSDRAQRDALNIVIRRSMPEIRRVLESYGVPPTAQPPSVKE